MPRLRVLAGPSVDELAPVSVNSDVPVEIKSDAFEGRVAVYIKGFLDPSGGPGDSAYFDKRDGVTWSIQVQGRFLQPHSADDILFGNTFARPLKLPWGFGAALKFMSYMDPTLEQDLASPSMPWALSPLITTMPYLEHTRLEGDAQAPPFPPRTPVENKTPELRFASDEGAGAAAAAAAKSSARRQSFFRDRARRKAVVFGPAVSAPVAQPCTSSPAHPRRRTSSRPTSATTTCASAPTASTCASRAGCRST
ncbi:hypothetical protein AcV5_003465 [Taiwanofungus camphoratus]|nr:hypothetical protein AcV5_003465 [Antrodia cinnamomea]